MYDTSVSNFGSQLEIALQRLSFVGSCFFGALTTKAITSKGIASKSTDKRRTTNIDKYTEKSGYGIKLWSNQTKKSDPKIDTFLVKEKVQRVVVFTFSLESEIK